MKFSFDEDARSEINGFFSEALEAVGKETATLFEELVSIYQREQYKPLWTVTDSVAEYYIGEFRQNVQRQFDNWTESETSLTAFAEDIAASSDTGDDAYVSAERMQSEMQDILDELFANQPDVPTISTEAHLTMDLSDIFEEIDELVQKYGDTMEDLTSEYDQKAEEKSEDNQIYANVSEILGAIMQSFQSLFMVFKDGVSKVSENIADRESSAVSKSEADKQQLKAEAENAGDALEDLSGLLDFN